MEMGRKAESRAGSDPCTANWILISTLWPLAEGTVHPGARFTQAELHLHGEGCCPLPHAPTRPSRWNGSPYTRPWPVRRRRDGVGWVPPSVAACT